MTATDELRRLLDERGVDWWNQTDPEPQSVTMARAGEQLISYHENANGSIGYNVFNMHDLTPEQAIAATLGAGTCHEVKIDRHYRGCSECGYIWEHMYAVGWQVGPKFCPNCGRRIEVGE